MSLRVLSWKDSCEPWSVDAAHTDTSASKDESGLVVRADHYPSIGLRPAHYLALHAPVMTSGHNISPTRVWLNPFALGILPSALEAIPWLAHVAEQTPIRKKSLGSGLFSRR
ncbi:hypothetical protein M8818_007099 [Zalaria obscura]|uniref:Uncharacterized protein n=1 Tax=Zalaria obscura TaxID=2024903 RepID=A0ACC3S409_9PEZI